jgi:hypothetical protein
MLCGVCRADNPTENRFCDQCGAALDKVCPSCGGSLRPEAKFCGACGKRLGEAGPMPPRGRASADPASPSLDYRSPVVAYTPRHLADKILRSRSALEGERRQVTVLFADIAGFTTIAERLDPEDVHRIVDRCFELITAEVHRFEGTINQYTGDGVMALFGAPIAHEDSPRRAAHATIASSRGREDSTSRCGSACTPGRWWWARSVTTCGWTTRRWATRPTWPPASSRPPGRVASW